VNSEMNDLVGNILRNKFYTYGYKLTTCYHVHANAHLSSALVCYLDATGTETLMLLNCILQGWGNYFCCSGTTLRRPHLAEGRGFL